MLTGHFGQTIYNPASHSNRTLSQAKAALFSCASSPYHLRPRQDGV